MNEDENLIALIKLTMSKKPIETYPVLFWLMSYELYNNSRLIFAEHTLNHNIIYLN